MFKRILFAVLLAAPLCVAFSASAEDKEKPMSAQQEKMGSCNKEAGAKELKGDDRKAFMKECLSKGKKPTQQEKMKTCNKDAKEMKGDDRKKFMSECLKADAK
jgi:hypothetical protein